MIVATSTEWAAEYRRREQMYRRWDHALAGRTRFFAAAAAICRALAALQSSFARHWVDVDCARFLASLSADLEVFNQDLAKRLAAGKLEARSSAYSTDFSIVRLEQARVQIHLTELRSGCGRAERRIVGGLSGLLNARGGWLCSGAERRVARALADARREVGRPLEFGLQADREAVGNRLIALMRAPAANAGMMPPTTRSEAP